PHGVYIDTFALAEPEQCTRRLALGVVRGLDRGPGGLLVEVGLPLRQPARVERQPPRRAVAVERVVRNPTLTQAGGRVALELRQGRRDVRRRQLLDADLEQQVTRHASPPPRPA